MYLADATDVTEVVVKDTRKAMAVAAANFYDHPSQGLSLVGITGTNGKTTTTYLVEHIARVAGKRTGVIGTVGVRVGDVQEKSAHTTPESPDLQQLFARMREARRTSRPRRACSPRTTRPAASSASTTSGAASFCAAARWPRTAW